MKLPSVSTVKNLSKVFGRNIRPVLHGLMLVLLLVVGALIHMPGDKKQAVITETPAAEKSTEPSIEQAEDSGEPVETAEPQTNSAPSTSGSKPSSSSQRHLTINPSTITVNTTDMGQYTYAKQINVSSNDGKSVSMPSFTTFQQDKFMLNFAAHPGKPDWTGDLIIYTTTPPGTYSFEIFAQDKAAAYYKGTVTVVVVEPSMNIVVEDKGYSTEYDALIYTVRINRLYGFSEAIDQVAVYGAADPNFACYYAIADQNTIDLYCGYEGTDPRPATSGSFTVEVATSSRSDSANISYSLPAYPN